MYDTHSDPNTVAYTKSFDNPFLHTYTVSKRFAFGFTVGVSIGITLAFAYFASSM